MRFFIQIFYLFYVLSGGFRHYSFNLLFAQVTSEIDFPTIANTAPYMEQFLMIVAFCILLFPLQKFLHLIMFIVLFGMDVFFQNAVSFTSCFILPHFYPLFFFLFLSFKNDLARFNLVRNAAILFVSVGLLTSFSTKMMSGWYRWEDPVIYSYIVQFFDGFQVPSISSGFLLNIQSHLFWKLADYSVLLFQFSFAFVFVRKSLFYPLTVFAVFFHVGIVLTLGIGVVFYLYILFYALIFFVSSSPSTIDYSKPETIKLFGYLATFVLFISFAFSRFDVHFVGRAISTSFFTYIDYLFVLVCIVTYVFCLLQWRANPSQSVRTF